eukprot:sb/3477273/
MTFETGNMLILSHNQQEPTETSKQPIRSRYIGHVIGYQPIRDQHFLIRVFIWDLYKRWASPRKKLTKLVHETSYLDYSIPSFKVPEGFKALAPPEVAPKIPETLNEGIE